MHPMLLGEQVDQDDNGSDRLTGDAGPHNGDGGFGAPALIRADIAWRGGNLGDSDGKIATLSRAGVRRAPAPVATPDLASIIVGSSKPAAALRDAVTLYAESDAPVLITGETGVGKELVASELHRRSARAPMPFVPVNAGAIPETLAATEFFGHTKGAFTGAVAEREGAIIAADGGALFLDEIGDMPMSIQAQLLRVLDDGKVTKVGARSSVKVDFRLIAATNVDLAESVRRGAFRRDLYYRINILTIDVPPLRERGDDVVEIADQMIGQHPDLRYRKATITPKAADRLRRHRFPGNVRELRNVVYRALVHTGGGKILPEHLALDDGQRPAAAARPFDVSQAQALIGRFIMLKALRASEGNVTKAAEIVGRSRGTVHAFTKGVGGADIAAEYRSVCAEIRALIDD